MRTSIVNGELEVTARQFKELVCSIGVNTEFNIDEQFMDATFVNVDFDFDPFAKHPFDVFHDCRPLLLSSLHHCDLVLIDVLQEIQLTKAAQNRRAREWTRKLQRAKGRWVMGPINLWTLFDSAPSPAPPSGPVDLQHSHLSKKLTTALLRARARVTLIQCAVRTFERDALLEFRAAHPPAFLCEQCEHCFASQAQLRSHQAEGLGAHRDLLHELVRRAADLTAVDGLFLSAQGRRLAARRLLFCAELQPADGRIQVRSPSPP